MTRCTTIKAKDQQKRVSPWLSMRVLLVVVMFVGVAFILSLSHSYKYVYRKDVYIDIVSSSLADGGNAAAVLSLIHI